MGHELRMVVLALAAVVVSAAPASAAQAQQLPWPAVEVPPASGHVIEHEVASYAVARARFWAASRSGARVWSESLVRKKYRQMRRGALELRASVSRERAATLRQRAVEVQEPETLDRSVVLYDRAVRAYRTLLDEYASSPKAARWRYDFADALHWTGRHREAAEEFARVRDSWEASLRLDAARRAVESLEAHVEERERAGDLPLVNRAPRPGEDGRVDPEPVPEVVRELGRARDLYVAMAGGDIADPALAEEAFQNAVVLYQHGYWPAAEERFRAVFEAACDTSSFAKMSWKNLNNIAVARDDTEAIERLAEAIQERACTFGRSEEEGQPDPSPPSCWGRPYPNCFEPLFDGDHTEASAERAARLVRCADEHPKHDYAHEALFRAALDLERTGYRRDAIRLYERIAEMEVDGFMYVAVLFRRAWNLERVYDFDAALRAYREVRRDRRVASSDNPHVQGIRDGALLHRGLLLRQLERYREAAAHFRRLARMAADADRRERARAELAETRSRAGRSTGRQRGWAEQHYPPPLEASP